MFKEKIAENFFPNLGEELDIQVQEADGTLYYLNAKTFNTRCSEMITVNHKELILRKARKPPHKETFIRI